MQIDSPSRIAEIRDECKAAYARRKTRFLVCAGTGCVAGGSLAVYGELKRLLSEKGIDADVELLFEGKDSESGVAVSGCHGFCQMGPLVRFEPKGVFYTKVKAGDVAEIVEASLEKDTVVERLLYEDSDGSRCLTEHEVPFYNRQKRIVLGKCGIINPEDIREYFAVDGYQALSQILQGYTPEQVIDVVSKSGLRGRGGAGFPVGKKWLSCLKAPGEPKYVVCNGDEGDPGAFMDRSVLEGDPHAVIEGMIISAYAIGASYGYIYVRAEYPLAVTRLQKAIQQAREWRLLGDNIMGTGFSFDPEVFQGAGAFVCGESTALVRSIEGYRGMPKPLPRARTTEEGLWGKPTLLNNVKTFSFIPDIIRRGADWFAATGTERSPGTAVFALTGKIRNSGLIEVPMGIKLREIIYDIGGGVPDGKEFKAVQTGGPSGGCLRADMLDLEVDFDSLVNAGSMMGSGGMVIMDETSCMVDIARYFVEFTVDESCGQCAPCRDGMSQMLKILEDITSGHGRPEDLDKLQEMGKAIMAGSICGLGQSAPNPVLSTLRYFRHEYDAHINEKVCTALNCKELIAYWIDPEKCKACRICVKACPTEAISGEKKMPHVIDQSKCSKCGICIDCCPAKFSAISKITGQQKIEIEQGVK
ncbi:MAG: NADH-quinone oxidoreductase subunit NuoF [Dethiobacter sp.]|jgi:NADH:ubiquinone oxidoreductase subunit F (NADH-binding)/(2Fe-2S) ferredoxin|nr:NADH-quinone oxidoreductase subunit NuoF [Dethiobacter sp.]